MQKVESPDIALLTSIHCDSQETMGGCLATTTHMGTITDTLWAWKALTTLSALKKFSGDSKLRYMS